MNENEKLLNMSTKEIEKMSNEERREFFEKLREYCNELKKYKTNITRAQKIISKNAYKLRNFDLEIIGEENIPKDGAIVMCNHSNSHDAFITLETLSSAGLPATFFASCEDISILSIALYKSARATMINREDKVSTINGIYDFSSKVLNGDTGIVFGESTWNLHPFKPMQNLKIGGVKISAISQKPIVPVIYEYVEVPEICSKESELYSKCIVKIGKPINIDPSLSLIEQNDCLQEVMENMRQELWKELGTYRESIEDVNPIIYVNHTWLKKYGTPLVDYNNEKENRMLFKKNGLPQENEYCFDKNGDFKPGNSLRKSYIKGLY